MPSPRAQQWPSPPRRALRRTHPLGGERPGSLLASTPGARVVHASLFKAGSKRDSRCIPPASRASARESMPNLAELTWRSLDARARHPAQVDRLDSPRAIPAGRRRPGPCSGEHVALREADRASGPAQPFARAPAREVADGAVGAMLRPLRRPPSIRGRESSPPAQGRVAPLRDHRPTAMRATRRVESSGTQPCGARPPTPPACGCRGTSPPAHSRRGLFQVTGCSRTDARLQASAQGSCVPPGAAQTRLRAGAPQRD